MNSRFAFLSTFALLLSTPSGFSQCASVSNIYSFTYSGKTYEVVKENKKWGEATICAVERGGILVEINNQAEQDAIYAQLANAGINFNNTTAPDGGGGAYLWIGGNDITAEGNWVWDGNDDGTSTQFWLGTASGSPVNGLYNNWGNEPDDYMNSQDGLALSLDGWPQGNASEWNDLNVANPLYYVIEYPSNVDVNEENNWNPYLLYPNPTSSSLQVQGCEAGSNYKIFNSTGQFIQSGTLSLHSTVDLFGLQQGTYFLQMANSKPLLFVKE